MQHLGFTRWGNPHGYPLAIIHGWGCDSSFLLPLAKMFADRDVYLIDLPGYGKSAHLAPMAGDLAATTYYLINTIPFAADVMAWSFGTLYALHAISAISNSCFNLEAYAASFMEAAEADKPLISPNDPRSRVSVSAPAATTTQGSSGGCTSMGTSIGSDINTPTTQIRTADIKLQRSTHAEHPLLKAAVQEYLNSCPYGHFTCGRPDAAAAEATGATAEATGATATATNAATVRTGAAGNGNAISTGSALSSMPERQTLLECKLCHGSQVPYIRSLITICGSPRFPSDPNWEGMSAMKILKCNTVLTPARLSKILHLFYRMMAHNASANESEYIKQVIAHAPPLPYEVLLSGIQTVTYVDERPAMQHLKVPSLHLFGAHDTLVPCSVAKFFNQDTPLHSSYVFPYSAHNPYLSEPERFEQVVRDFFESLAQFDYGMRPQATRPALVSTEALGKRSDVSYSA